MRKKSANAIFGRLAAAAATAGIAITMAGTAFAGTYDLAGGSITITGSAEGTYVRQGDGKEIEDNETITITQTGENSTENTITIKAEKNTSVDVTLSGVNIDASGAGEAAITVKGDGNVSLELDGKNEVKSGTNHAGIEKNDTDGNGTLTIKDEKNDNGTVKTGETTDTTGSLTATGGAAGAGIGGGTGKSSSNLVISSGEVSANAGSGGAGIGGGSGGNGTVTINGGTVSATGVDKNQGNGAGIGGGKNGAGNVTIEDGNVTAIGGVDAAGIGGGFNGAGTVTVKAGTVVATGGKNSSIIYEKASPMGAGGYSTLLGGNKSDETIKISDGSTVEEYPYITGSDFNGHEWTTEVTKEPTCTTPGMQVQTCSKHGCKKTEELPSLGHSWDEGTVTTPATYETEGVMTYTCTATDCTATKTESIPVLVPEENSVEELPLTVNNGMGTPIAYEQTLENGCVIFSAPAEDAVLSGGLGALAELKAQGATTLVFRTQLCETSVSMDKLLAMGSENDVFVLTHKGTEAVLTVEGRVIK